MAEVKCKGKKFQLTMSVGEAAYVWAALNKCDPYPADYFGKDDDDPVHEALEEALESKGVALNTMRAKVFGNVG